MVVMEQQEHIATLCAAGTVGIAVAGFALGTEDSDAQTTTPGKRKRPGASSVKSPTTPQIPFTGARRVISQPTTSTSTPQEQDQTSLSSSLTSSLFRRRPARDLRPHTGNQSDTTAESRGSSLNRSSILRPRTADTRTTSERRDTSTSSSWLKRISTVSSLHGVGPTASIRQQDDTPAQSSELRVTSANNLMPNKLVKRSTSQRALSTDHAQGSFLRRPVTSHQRTATLREWDLHRHRRVATATSNLTQEVPEMETSSPPVWRPFFERGYPRKRHSTGGVRDIQPVRTIVATGYGQPTLILGHSVETSEAPEDQFDRSPTAQEALAVTSNRQRLRRSLSSMHRASRRRYFTDPVVKASTETANGTISSATKQSPLSPVSHSSTFDIELPHSSPAFSSSPTFIPVSHRFSFRKRESTAPSDPTTISSDNDTRVFTDDESMDYQSDTAYDSLNTRATASSHSAIRPPKLETIFNNAHPLSNNEPTTTLEDLMHNTTLNDTPPSHIEEAEYPSKNHGIGISGLENEDSDDVHMEESASLTPVKPIATGMDEWLATPVPIKPTLVKHRTQHPPDSIEASQPANAPTEIGSDTRPNSEDAGDIDWSPISNDVGKEPRVGLPSATARTLSDMCSSPLVSRPETDTSFEEDQLQTDKRASIFDWSEQQRVAADSTFGVDTRPKTVHGKQVNDNSRSRSSGRKAPNQLHLRSQSVPNNRDSQVESTPLSTSKFSTWGLGHKPVSEEWSDDFEFDDAEEEQEVLPQLTVSSAEPIDRGSLRGVKVPQSIIDRQASVHIQFGQVQEFMLLVEELKRLRARGLALDLIQRHSKQLWDDAENIINLATINDEEDDIEDVRPLTPTISDAFGEDGAVTMKSSNAIMIGEEERRNLTNRPSFSNPATPPHGRPRGESLAQANIFLQTIHQSRGNNDSSPFTFDDQPLRKLPFDTQDLKDLVFRSGVITRALKEIVRKAEGVSVSPNKTPPRYRDPAFSQIFNAPDTSPCPPFRNPTIPKSRSAHSYLSTSIEHNNNGEMSSSFTTLQAAMCN